MMSEQEKVKSNDSMEKGDSFQRRNALAGGDGQNHGRAARATLKIRHGAYLPHWTREGATYFTTFRLGDSLPAPVLRAWEFERNQILINAEKMNRPLTDYEQERLDKLFSEKVEAYLDAGNGACWLKNDRVAAILAGTLNHFNNRRYQLHAWSIMPNHAHVVVQPLPGFELPTILNTWKSYTAHQANKLLGRQGMFWQPESYDHIIRDEEEYYRLCIYTWSNPDKAKLQDWKWRWIAESVK